MPGMIHSVHNAEMDTAFRLQLLYWGVTYAQVFEQLWYGRIRLMRVTCNGTEGPVLCRHVICTVPLSSHSLQRNRERYDGKLHVQPSNGMRAAYHY